MFKNNAASNGSPGHQDPDSPERLNRVVEGASLEGELKCDSNIRIDGRVKGTVETKGRLVVGPTGVIEGDVVCGNGEIEGRIEGQISVQELLSLRATAKVSGDIRTKQLAIEPGAEFEGTCSMDSRQGPAQQEKQPNGKRQKEQRTEREGTEKTEQ